LEERFERHKKAFIEHANSIGVDLTILESEADAALQLTQIESMISNNCDALIVLAADSDASSTIGSMVKDAGIPLISYNTFVMNCDVDYYIGYSDPWSGQLIAEAIMDGGKTKGNVAFLRGDATNGVQQDMSKGFDAYMEKYITSGQVKVVADQFIKNWAADTAMTEAENILTKNNNDIKAFAVWNDTMAGGVVQALTEQGLAGQVIVTGGDMDIAACQRIAAGTQTTTFYKPDKEICCLTLDVTVAILKGEDPAKVVDYEGYRSVLGEYDNGYKTVPIMQVQTENVDKDNLAEYMINTRYYDLAEVYKYVPEDEWPDAIKQELGK
jgi:D-xylose transport system substrate-binding protein